MARSWLEVLCASAAACGGAPDARMLRLLEYRQQDFDSVALNEELLFYFSADLDPSSVTSDSVSIQDEQGGEVDGQRAVRGNALSFLPELPRAADLSDGGLRPGARYRVILGGFPRPDGIRSTSGALLSSSLLLFFGTAEVGGSSPLFLDPFVGPFPLLPSGKRVYPIELEDGRLVLEYGEALDPSSVPACRFELLRYPTGGGERETIPTTVRLIENRRNHAALLVETLGPLGGERLPPDTYYLSMPGRELRTLGGRAVEPGWGRGLLQLVVPQARIELSLGAARERTGDLPPGCDGTAVWSDTGHALHVRYPLAAGDGSAGVVELRDSPHGSDTPATRLLVPTGAVADLSALTGPVVLRAQTSIEVRGRLTRRGPAADKDPLTLELERAAKLPPSHWAPLSAWVERLLEEEGAWARQPWTVLIAGGDIRVPQGGAIEVEGPLVLVAGGWIRVAGQAVPRGRLWMTPEWDGNLGAHSGKGLLPLALDPPLENPLRTKLTAGLLTRAFPWTPWASRWRTLLIGHEGSGRLDARFLQTPPGSGIERVVSDPSELGAGPVRALLRLELGPGQAEPWNPPRLERLVLEALSAGERP
jgi:hypothetical protein